MGDRKALESYPVAFLPLPYDDCTASDPRLVLELARSMYLNHIMESLTCQFEPF